MVDPLSAKEVAKLFEYTLKTFGILVYMVPPTLAWESPKRFVLKVMEP